MKPWEDTATVARFRRMRGGQSLRIAGDLIEGSLTLLKESIKAQHPRWTRWQRQQELDRIFRMMGHGV